LVSDDICQTFLNMMMKNITWSSLLMVSFATKYVFR